MSAQTRYGYSSPIGSAGGIVDLAPYAIDTFLNEEENGKVKFGMGVVTGTNKGSGIKLPVKGSTAANFEGITVNRRTTESDMEGAVSLRKSASIGVMKYGRIYVRVAKTVKPGYTDGGIALVQNQMIASLKAGQDVGGIAESEFDEDGNEIPGFWTSVPTAASLSASEKASRKLTKCKFKARLAGAIHFAEIKGSLTYTL